MKKPSEEIVRFLQNQGFVVVSTIDKKGYPHNSCKGILEIDKEGRVYLLDLYRGNTYANLKRDPRISITAVDEHKFKGYCLKGKAEIVAGENLDSEMIKAWETRLTARITQRLLKNLREEKGHPRHPEALLPKPEYMIVMKVDEVINLAPSI
ncbi:MAG: pyridoxamine 5'-phosphate oxidase family protein [Candidatus Omnitrophota bacterium]|jgi:predicted pyridoxine 5'-phosphate oxidase superfamily flavin-nucleotide-binding protein